MYVCMYVCLNRNSRLRELPRGLRVRPTHAVYTRAHARRPTRRFKFTSADPDNGKKHVSMIPIAPAKGRAWFYQPRRILWNKKLIRLPKLSTYRAFCWIINSSSGCWNQPRYRHVLHREVIRIVSGSQHRNPHGAQREIVCGREREEKAGGKGRRKRRRKQMSAENRVFVHSFRTGV